ncbi:MAG: GGDEF domain-containing protein [Lachnospiraceae bacterium]|nr:GGDEF domain-containing protein [Lachnospiraceae bacterium]
MTSVNKAASRRFFMILAIGIASALLVDSVCAAVDGSSFKGASLINGVANAFYFSICSIVACIWSKYAILHINIKFTRKIDAIMVLPAVIVSFISFYSLNSGWIFSIDDSNHYVRGPLFFIHIVVSFGYLLATFVYIVILKITKKYTCSVHAINFILLFYVLPIVGAIFSTAFAGMPGLWPATAMSLTMVYIDMQDEAILTDGLTGLNNRKVLRNSFQYYVKNVSPDNLLVIYMIDLNKFKQINDTYGHLVGDEALVNAANILKQFVSDTNLLLVRYGGDEFLMIGLLNNEKQAEIYKDKLLTSFDNWNRDNTDKIYRLNTSVGYQIYHEGDTLEGMIEKADNYLYEQKKKRR